MNARARQVTPGLGGWLAIAVCIVLHAAAAIVWGIPGWVAGAQVAASIVCFGAYALDKAAARAGRRRVPERRLLVLGLIGGWPGAIIAQRLLRHKTIKPAFRRAFVASVMVHLAASAAIIAVI